jgi:DNA gyrase subunit A
LKTTSGKKQIIIKEIPYQVNKTTLIERIAELAKEKIIDGITISVTSPIAKVCVW